MDDEDRYTRITLRIPKDLDRRIQQRADVTSKSKNAEIIARLQESFDVPEDVRKRIKAAADQTKQSMGAMIKQAVQSYFDDLDREEWFLSDEYHNYLNDEYAKAEEEARRVPVPVRPKSAAIRVAEMTREQKKAFIASIDRSLEAPGTSDAERSMLTALRNAAQEEVAVIDKQLKQLK